MLKWILIILVVIIITIVVVLRPLFKSPAFPTPTGKYGVGTTIIDISYNTTEDKNRDIPLQIFYPVDINTTGDKLPTMDKRVSKKFSELYKFPGMGGEEVYSNSVIDGKIIDIEEKLPTIIFSHGGYSYSTQNLSTFEELASNGYVVISVSHTDEAVLTLFSDGREVELKDKKTFQDSMKIGKEKINTYMNNIEFLKSNISRDKKRDKLVELGDTFYKDLENYFYVRLEDIKAIIDNLNNINENPILMGKIDQDNLAMFGHSFGGIITTTICTDKNSQIKAGINMDAPAIIYDNSTPELKRPFAFFYSTGTSLGKKKMDLTDANSYYSDSSEYEVFSLTFNGSAHYNFSDFNYMPKLFKYTPMLGSVDQALMSKMMNKTVLDFFNYTLKDDKNNQFNSKKSPYEDVRFN